MNALKARERRRKSSKKRVTVVKTSENDRSNKFGQGICGKVFADSGDAAELEVAGARDGSSRCERRNGMFCFMERMLSRVTTCSLTAEDRGTEELKSSRVRGDFREFRCGNYQNGFSFVTVELKFALFHPVLYVSIRVDRVRLVSSRAGVKF